jgi:hypothetical protein
MTNPPILADAFCNTIKENQKYFCAHESRTQQEPLYGTASHVRYLFALEYNAPWTDKAVGDSTIPDAAKQALIAKVKAFPAARLVLIRRSEHQQEGPIHFYAVHNDPQNPYTNKMMLDSYADLHDLDLEQALVKTPHSSRDPLYMICTNGNKDKCCAKYGMELYRFIRNHVDKNRVWQCTHLGGDRFAPNVVMAPHGAYFGQIMPPDFQKFVDDAESDMITLKNYRGLCWYDRAGQTADYFARKTWQNFDYGDVLCHDAHIENELHHLSMHERSTGEKLRLTLQLIESDFEMLLTCTATVKSRAKWFIPLSIEKENS